MHPIAFFSVPVRTSRIVSHHRWPSSQALDQTGKSYEYGYNPTDTRHNISISTSFGLPFGMQMSGIARIISNEPLAVTTGLDLDGDTITVDRPVGLAPTVGHGDVQKQLDIVNAYRQR